MKRPFYKLTLSIKRTKIEDVSKEDLEHFFQSLLQNLNSCIHLTVKYGENDHHKVEAAMKSLAVAFRNATLLIKNKKEFQVQKVQCNDKIAIFDYGAGNIFSLKIL